MPKTRDTTVTERSAIIALHEEGVSLTNLASRYHVDRRTIMRICSRYQRTSSFSNMPRSGRYKATTKREDRMMHRLQRKTPMASSSCVSSYLYDQTGKSVSAVTVRRRLLAMGLRSRIAKRKPLISAVNKRKRLQWAKAHRHWTIAQWKHVLFSDEVPIPFIQIAQQRRVRCYPSEVYLPGMTRPMMQCGGGQMMYWGCFQDNEVGPLVEITGRLNAAGYVQLLENNLNIAEMHQNNVILQQDNAPIHKAKHTMGWIAQQHLRVLDWPPQSPDCNPIENAWSQLKRDLDKLRITSKAMMRVEIQRLWMNMDASYLQGLVESMPRRVAAVIRNRGGPTKY
jgi:transposase